MTSLVSYFPGSPLGGGLPGLVSREAPQPVLSKGPVDSRVLRTTRSPLSFGVGWWAQPGPDGSNEVWPTPSSPWEGGIVEEKVPSLPDTLALAEELRAQVIHLFINFSGYQAALAISVSGD